VPKGSLRALTAAIRAAIGETVARGFSISLVGDPEAALGIHRPLAQEPTLFHLHAEFRKNAVSPYRRISAEKLGSLMNVIERYGQKITLQHWREEEVIDRNDLLAKEPGLRQLVEAAAIELEPGCRLRITGVQLSMEGKERPGGILFRWAKDDIRLDVWAEGGPARSVAEALQMGPALTAAILRLGAREERNGTSRG
jgi:hypothetical protein